MTGLQAVRAAMARGAWATALDELATLNDASDEALEIRAGALYALGDFEGCLTTWERLHARCAASGDHDGAARAAAMTALYLLIDTGLMAPVRGWLARAKHALGDAAEGPVHALVEMVGAYERLLCGDVDGCAEHAAVAVDLGERHGVLPAVVVGQVALARVLVFHGRVADGLRALDEAGARLMCGDVDPLTTGMMLCELVCAAQGLAMPDRAREWTDVMDRWRGAAAFGALHGRCRVHRAELLRISGPCDAAEDEALAACAELRPWLRREYGWPLVELGTIRLRKGDLAGAEAAFGAAHDLAWSAQPGLALLRLAQGDAPVAAAMIADAIAHPDEIPWKERPPVGELQLVPLFEAQAEIAATTGDTETCTAAASALGRIARDYPSRGIAATASLAQARAALLQGKSQDARAQSFDAARVWADLGAPFESAVARVVAGDALAAAGNRQAASAEWAAAQRAFTAYGAEQRSRDLAARLERPTRTPTRGPVTATFRRDGPIRLIGFADATSAVPELIGFDYLDQLIRCAGQEVAAVDLVAIARHQPAARQLGLPALDTQARDAYRRRLAEIDEDIAEADAMHDEARAAMARRDRDFLVAELTRAVGLGGRIRDTSSTAERARTSVFRAIRYAIDRIAQVQPALAEHLRHSTHTGSRCHYTPDPLTPVHWQL